jgi:hypothetical protein
VPTDVWRSAGQNICPKWAFQFEALASGKMPELGVGHLIGFGHTPMRVDIGFGIGKAVIQITTTSSDTCHDLKRT